MKHLLFLSFFNQFACLDILKPEEEEDEEDEDFKEGDQVGDCYDGEDNDEDGVTDCEDPGCFDKPACNDTGWTQPDTGDTQDTDEGEQELYSLSLDWEFDGIQLGIAIEYNPPSADYYWGIAETDGDCLTSQWGCWTGEDCFMGFEGEISYRYCHPISENGAWLLYGGDFLDLAEGSETIFSSPDFERLTTHIIDDRGSTDGPCWVFGADPEYYDGYEKDCTEM